MPFRIKASFFSASLCAAVAMLVVARPAQSQNLASNYATAVAFAGDDLLVGEPDNHYRPGVVYVYRRDESGDWTEAEQLVASDADLFDGFGASLAVDGDVLTVGALRQNGGSGAVYVFGRRDGRWIETARLTADDAVSADRFGASVAGSTHDTQCVTYRGSWPSIPGPRDLLQLKRYGAQHRRCDG